MAEWPVIYLGWLLFAIVGGLVGYRACWYVHRYQRRRLVARWRIERRKHRQRNPWVKRWVSRQFIDGIQWPKPMPLARKPLVINSIKLGISK